MKTDDDAFVRIDEVLSSLKQKASDGLLYGLISFESKPQRDAENKWFISTEVLVFVKLTIIESLAKYLRMKDDCDFFGRNGHMRATRHGLMVQVI